MGHLERYAELAVVVGTGLRPAQRLVICAEPEHATLVRAVAEAGSLRTGADGKVGVTLKDDTRLALGPSSEVRLERFSYSPGTASLGMVLKFVRGVTAYVSGRLAKLAPDSIRLETPSAIVGVRGTTLAIRVEG